MTATGLDRVVPARGFVSHIDLNVVDLDRSTAFYGLLLEYLGMERVRADDRARATWRLVSSAGYHVEIEIRRPRGQPSAARHARHDPGLDHLALHAASEADVDGLYETLRANGYLVDEPPRHYDYAPGYYAVGFDDPDGTRLEVVYDPSTNP